MSNGKKVILAIGLLFVVALTVLDLSGLVPRCGSKTAALHHSSTCVAWKKPGQKGIGPYLQHS